VSDLSKISARKPIPQRAAAVVKARSLSRRGTGM